MDEQGTGKSDPKLWSQFRLHLPPSSTSLSSMFRPISGHGDSAMHRKRCRIHIGGDGPHSGSMAIVDSLHEISIQYQPSILIKQVAKFLEFLSITFKWLQGNVGAPSFVRRLVLAHMANSSSFIPQPAVVHIDLATPLAMRLHTLALHCIPFSLGAVTQSDLAGECAACPCYSGPLTWMLSLCQHLNSSGKKHSPGFYKTTAVVYNNSVLSPTAHKHNSRGCQSRRNGSSVPQERFSGDVANWGGYTPIHHNYHQWKQQLVVKHKDQQIQAVGTLVQAPQIIVNTLLVPKTEWDWIGQLLCSSTNTPSTTQLLVLGDEVEGSDNVGMKGLLEREAGMLVEECTDSLSDTASAHGASVGQGCNLKMTAWGMIGSHSMAKCIGRHRVIGAPAAAASKSGACGWNGRVHMEAMEGHQWEGSIMSIDGGVDSYVAVWDADSGGGHGRPFDGW
ncbi:hypothetical protein IW261DRAFT_1420853 [Armillaria novae-zelandiae]|uniref:Uncharacterized protein n=1 Tax=Armillaria novae-zelandiae TaxID=153914 RepID=A0AA39P605_9AGAR|nr:hypothetical protein IW261DRAFT_1420853 [Armillaria novae-zelandiae]